MRTQDTTTWLLTLTLAAPLALGACSHDKNKKAPTPDPSEVAEFDREDDATVRTVDVVIHPTIRSACEVDAPSAYFKYDSAKLSWSDKELVDDVAACLETGALKAETLKLTGRADPKGPEDYNKELGMERAQTIKDALVKHGVAKDRIVVTSKGEKGFDESSSELIRSLQRRVDLDLVDPRPVKLSMTYWDLDDDGYIDRGEFYTYFDGVHDFAVWDNNDDGWLSEDELSTGVFAVWDSDSDGELSESEFNDGTVGWYRVEDNYGTFAAWDTDGDGIVSDDEWAVSFADKGIFASWDADEDEQLDDDEMAVGIYGYWDTDDDDQLDDDETVDFASLYWLED